MVVLIEDIGLLPGAMKLFGEGGTSYADVMLGDAKSSIWLFKMIPVEGDMNLQPQIRLTEAVTETASPSGERKLMWYKR